MDTNINNITVTGQVIQGVDGAGKASLLVYAMENSLNAATGAQTPATLGSTTTDQNGRFTMSVSDNNLRQGIAPDLYFNVYDVDGKTLLASTADYVIWNGNTQEDVTIKLRGNVVTPALGKNRITTLQAQKAGVFVTQSDFTGAFSHVKDQAGTSFGILGTSLMDSISKINLQPIKVSVPAATIVDSNVTTAGQALTDQNIQYQVADYQPGINKDLLQSVTGFNPVVRQGESVKLYQQDGVVKYYSIVKDSDTAAPAAVETAAPAESAAKLMSTTYDTAPAAAAPAATTDHAADIATLKEQLSTTQKDAAEKDKNIADLTSQLEAIRKQQASMMTMLNAKLGK